MEETHEDRSMSDRDASHSAGPFALVLGITQDGGHPHAGCDGSCCREAWTDLTKRHRVACLGLVDPFSSRHWLIDATPDIKDQLNDLQRLPVSAGRSVLSGVFLTHGHMGHYSGLLHLGREVMGTQEVPVHAMPGLASFLASNSPWSDLAEWGHVEIRRLEEGTSLDVAGNLQITPFLVPHRGEFSETVGYRLKGPRRTLLYLPDIDSWDEWHAPLGETVCGVDVALLDGTFYDHGELPGRDMSAIPHPLIRETMQRLAGLPPEERAKVRFVHLNHTNPVLRARSEAWKEVHSAGFLVAREGERIDL
jgi:pyrroloquinoline quinone biosynthesis protein B